MTVAPATVNTGTGMGGARASIEVPRTTAVADGASDTATPDTVMAEPPAVIDCVPIANTGTTAVVLGVKPGDSSIELAVGLLIGTIAGIKIALEPTMAVKVDANCAEAGA